MKKSAPKNICKILFTNKALDFIDFKTILKKPSIKNLIPNSVNVDSSPMVVYNLTKPIRSHIFNHKKFVQELDVEEFLNNPDIFLAIVKTQNIKTYIMDI